MEKFSYLRFSLYFCTQLCKDWRGENKCALGTFVKSPAHKQEAILQHNRKNKIKQK